MLLFDCPEVCVFISAILKILVHEKFMYIRYGTYVTLHTYVEQCILCMDDTAEEGLYFEPLKVTAVVYSLR